MKKLRISDISKLFHIPVSALRYYEKEGLCCFQRSENNYRWADMMTIRNLCDISFYRKLSCPVEQIAQLRCMSHQKIVSLLLSSRVKVEQQILQLNKMLDNIDEKLNRVQKIDRLREEKPSIVKMKLPEIREFDLFCSEDISKLIDYERNLFIIIDPESPSSFCYGLSHTFDGNTSKKLLHPEDESEKDYFKILLQTDYEKIEKNNLEPYLSQIVAMGYLPGKVYGKVLVSADEGGLRNYYEAWIELLPRDEKK